MTAPPLAIDEVNALDHDAFMARFASVYESTPALAAAAWESRPFADRASLTAAFGMAASGLDEAGCLALLCAHPELAAPAGAALTADSHREQQSAGLTDLDAQIGERIRSGNARYRERFGFPFIIAVDGLGPADVAAALDERLGHGATEERATALAQVARIAQGRIARIVAP